MTMWGQSKRRINNTKPLRTRNLPKSPFFPNKHTQTHLKAQKDVYSSVLGGCSLFPSNLIVSLLASDLWHFPHSSHLLVSHLPGSTPEALN